MATRKRSIGGIGIDDAVAVAHSLRFRTFGNRYPRTVVRIPDDREHRFQSNVHTDSGHVEQRFQDGEHGFRGTCTLVGSEVRQAASSKGRTQPCRHRDYRHERGLDPP